MNRIFTLFLIAGPTSVLAQPVIDVPNIPLVGDITTIGLCDDIVDAPSLNAATGAMVTWDFSGLNETSEEQFTFVDPATTPWAANFPNSNLCGVSWDDAYSYYIVGSGALRTEGNALIIPGTPPEDTLKILLASDPELIIELPYTFGDGSSDTFSGTFQAGIFAGTVDGTIEQSVDGYGTLILPNATYTNVVRYHFNRVQVNTMFGNTATQTKEQWAWVSADHRFWLLLMEINGDGFGTSDLVWYDKDPAPAGPSSIAETNSTNFQVHPNPVAIGSPITIQRAGIPFGTRAELTDATGRLVRTYGSVATTLATDGLMAGAYVLRLTDTNGTTMATTRVILR
ncbi:MAG: T9SS type A sorting domain-containing protein [Flavobacteriales bacterium]|nr:T9SS type A sorting domain-containing protein [Flavobacteriales bacterium]